MPLDPFPSLSLSLSLSRARAVGAALLRCPSARPEPFFYFSSISGIHLEYLSLFAGDFPDIPEPKDFKISKISKHADLGLLFSS